MEWLSKPEEWAQSAKKRPRPLALCLGNFDGIHLGHRELIRRVTHFETAAVFTFNPHPVFVLKPDTPHLRLFDFEDQKSVMEALGVDMVFIQPFTTEFSQVSAEDFFKHTLVEKISPQHIVVGEDFQFGRSRHGDTTLLKKLCEQSSIGFETVAAVKDKGERVSTSRIRHALLNHQPALAAELLGRPYYLKGVVERGEQRGRQLGFPTANIKPFLEFRPSAGVYISQTTVNGKIHPSVTNIGLNKTFVDGDHHPFKVETFILDGDHQIYGREIKVELLEWVREEKKFAGLNELVAQIKNDVSVARQLHQQWQERGHPFAQRNHP